MRSALADISTIKNRNQIKTSNNKITTYRIDIVYSYSKE